MGQLLAQWIDRGAPGVGLGANGAPPDHPNVDMIRHGYRAVERGDFETLDEIFTDDVTWYGLADSRNPLLRRVYRGKAEVFGLVGELGAGSLRRDVRDVIANDRWAAAWVRESGVRETGVAAWDELQIFTFDGEGRIKDVRGLPFDMSVVDAFWS